MSDQNPPETAEENKGEEKPKLFLDEETGEQVSKNELKKRKKLREKEKKKKEKEEAKRKKEEEKKANKGESRKLEVGDDKDMDPNKYTENR